MQGNSEADKLWPVSFCAQDMISDFGMDDIRRMVLQFTDEPVGLGDARGASPAFAVSRTCYT